MCRPCARVVEGGMNLYGHHRTALYLYFFSMCRKANRFSRACLAVSQSRFGGLREIQNKSELAELVPESGIVKLRKRLMCRIFKCCPLWFDELEREKQYGPISGHEYSFSKELIYTSLPWWKYRGETGEQRWKRNQPCLSDS